MTQYLLYRPSAHAKKEKKKCSFPHSLGRSNWEDSMLTWEILILNCAIGPVVLILLCKKYTYLCLRAWVSHCDIINGWLRQKSISFFKEKVRGNKRDGFHTISLPWSLRDHLFKSPLFPVPLEVFLADYYCGSISLFVFFLAAHYRELKKKKEKKRKKNSSSSSNNKKKKFDKSQEVKTEWGTVGAEGEGYLWQWHVWTTTIT